MTRWRFTGRHMFGVLIVMFGVIIAVNLTMARYAVTTFGGTVVDNSYVATREYNRWLAEAAAQKRLEWHLETELGPQRRLRITVDRAGAPINGRISVIASHPLGRAPDRPIDFARVGEGHYLAKEMLPPGRWLLNITVRKNRDVAHFTRDVRS